MPHSSKLQVLPHVAPPVLTAYLDVNPANPRNQGSPRGYATWLASTGQAVAKQLPPEARKPFRAELERVNRYLQLEPPTGRGLVVFSGPEVWEVIPLQVDVREELHWGKPSLQQMLWVLDEHEPRGVVVINGSGARFFQFWLGAVTEEEAAAFSVDTSEWRRKHLVGPSQPVVPKQHGAQRDRVEDRLAAQRGRFARELARRIRRWADEIGANPVLLVGTGELLDATVEAMPAAFRKRVAVLRKALPRTSPGEVKTKLGPVLERWERDYEKALVDGLLAARGSRRVALGLDETLAQIQDDRVRELIVARGLTGSARQCIRCGRADRSADPVCVACGGERRTRTLRTLLPELASLHAIPVEIVAGDAARRLREVDGIGAWLGAFKRTRAPGKSPAPQRRTGSAQEAGTP